MRKELFFVLPASLLIVGCATTGKTPSIETRLTAVETRVTALEQKQAGVEVKATEIPEAPKETAVVSPDEAAAAKRFLSKKEIQAALKNAGYYNGPIDGKIGVETTKAIKEFQKANNLKADGIVGTKTKALLIKNLSAAQTKK